MKIYVVECNGDYTRQQLGYSLNEEIAEQQAKELEKEGWYGCWVEEYQLNGNGWCRFEI